MLMPAIIIMLMTARGLRAESLF